MQELEKISPTTRGPALANYKKQLVLTQRQREIGVGVILGDASLNTQDKRKSYRLKFEQGIHHLDYINHLHGEFDYFCLSEVTVKKRVNANDNLVETAAFQTLSHVSLNEFADLFLNDKGKKVIKPNLVRDHLTEIGLAYWFMDDGGKLDFTKNQGKAIVLHTQGFFEKEVSQLAKELEEKFALQSRATKNKGKFVVQISGHSYERFIELIDPHIIESMRYKLPLPRKS